MGIYSGKRVQMTDRIEFVAKKFSYSIMCSTALFPLQKAIRNEKKAGQIQK